MAYLMSQGIQIGKVAERTGLSIDTIRFYQKTGLVKQPARSEGGFRLFTDADMKDLAFIKKAQELGFSLNEIKQLSILNQDHGHACSQVRDLLEGKLRDVREKAAQLLRLEAELNKALRKCNRDLRSHPRSAHGECCPVLKALEEDGMKPRSRRTSHD
jgi:DNA-binding transcriptional MerR regulator